MIPTRIDTSETDTSNKTDDQRRVQTNQRLSSSSITKPVACHLFINQMITNKNKLSFTEFISDQVIYSRRLFSFLRSFYWKSFSPGWVVATASLAPQSIQIFYLGSLRTRPCSRTPHIQSSRKCSVDFAPHRPACYASRALSASWFCEGKKFNKKIFSKKISFVRVVAAAVVSKYLI